jgi:hypothetical protein
MPEPSAVLAFDTGYQTGVALWLHEPQHHQAWDASAESAMDWFDDWTARTAFGVGGLTVIAERITITSQTHKKGDQVLSSVEQIGVLRHLCRQRGFTFVGKQTPAEAKGFSNDRKLKAMGWWTVGTDHARDASRHLMLYLAETQSTFREQLARKIASEEED